MNDLYCSAASAKQELHIPVASHFVCPQCGKPLSVPRMAAYGMTERMLVICGGLVLAGGALFAAGAIIGKGPPEQPSAPLGGIAAAADSGKADAVSAPAPPPEMAARLEPARTGAASRIRPDGARAPIAAFASVSPRQPRQAAATPQLGSHPPSMHLAMLQTMAKSPAPRGDMAVPPSAQQPPIQPQRASPSASWPARGQTALAQASARQARAAEQTRRAQEALLALQQQKTAALQAQASQRRADQPKVQAAARLAATPPVARGPTRAFSASAVAGGAPAYPQAYEADGRAGRVTVNCLIRQNGAPSGCHVVTVLGGVGFSNAALGWLRSGAVRFAPVLRDGQAQAEEHSWTINFKP